MPKPALKDYLPPLDALRGIAALVVAFLTHRIFITYNDLPQMFHLPRPLAALVNSGVQHGWLGVDLFFVLSGFIFYRIYRRKIEDKEITLKAFWVLRFSRLFPVYWLTLVVLLLLYALTAIFGVPFESMSFGAPAWSLSLSNFIQAVPLLHGLGMSDATLFNGPSWSLVFELFGYALFFFIATKSKRENGILLYLAPVFVGLILVNREYLGHKGALPFPLLNYAGGQRLLISFFMGCLTCEAHAHIKTEAARRRAGLATGAASLLVPFIFWLGDRYPAVAVGDTALIAGLFWFPCMVMAALTNRPVGWFLSLRFFRWLGDLSYSVYIWHLPTANIVLLALSLARRMEWRSAPALFLGWVAFTLAVAHVSHYYFERPVQRWIRGKMA